MTNRDFAYIMYAKAECPRLLTAVYMTPCLSSCVCSCARRREIDLQHWRSDGPWEALEVIDVLIRHCDVLYRAVLNLLMGALPFFHN